MLNSNLSVLLLYYSLNWLQIVFFIGSEFPAFHTAHRSQMDNYIRFPRGWYLLVDFVLEYISSTPLIPIQ